MDRSEIQDLIRRADLRNEKRAAFLRHLLLLSTGALTLLVSLRPEASSSRAALWSLRLAWPSLGVGILALAVALYEEVWGAKALQKKMARDIADGWYGAVPTHVPPPAIFDVCEKVAYGALTASVLALVIHGVCR